MRIAATVRLTAALFAAAAHGCSGYSDGVGQRDPVEVEPTPADAEAPREEPEPPQSQPEQPAPEQPADAGMQQPSEPVQPSESEPMVMDAGEPSIAQPRRVDVNLRMLYSPEFDGYLADREGRPLYMHIGDVAGGRDSACLYECATEWPPFDVLRPHVSAELDTVDVARFHRSDGAWQTTYKGHPLYYRATEADPREVTGDRANGGWFVARDYLTFMSAARTFTPQGGAGGTNSAFLTDGFGRTLYVCLDDQPSTDTSEALSSCSDSCLLERPIFDASATGRTTQLPSVMDLADLRELQRPDGLIQLTYRGWPLYYFSEDTKAGSTAGHNDRAWRAIDPITFGLFRGLDASY